MKNSIKLDFVGMAVVSMVSLHVFGATWVTSTPNYSSWNDPANWSDGVVPGADATAGFGWKNDSDRPVSSYYYIELGASQEIAKLSLNEWNTFPSPMYIGLTRDRLFGRTLTLQNVSRADHTSGSSYINADVILSGDSTWFVHKGYNGDMTVNGSISGPYALTKTGSGGTLIFAARNTYTGTTTVSEGTLRLGNGSDAGLGSGVAGDIVNNSALELDPARGDRQVVANLTGTGSVTKKGLGMLVFSGSDHLGEGGTLKITQHNWQNYGVGPIDSTVTNGVMNFSAYNFNYSFDFLGSQNLDLGSGAVTLTKWDNNDSTERSVGVLKNTLTIGGPISGSPKFTKSGRGTLVLKSASTYTGATSVSVGMLKLTEAATLGTGAVSVGGGAELSLEAADSTVDRIPDTVALSLGGSLVQNAAAMETAGALTLKAGSATIRVADTQATSGFTFASFASREAGNTTLFDLAGDSTVAFTSATEGTVLAGALLKRGTAVTFASIDANGVVVPLAADGSDNVKMELTGDISLPAATYGTLELRNDSGNEVTVTLEDSLVTTNGLLLSGSSPITITGGTIFGNDANEAIVLVASSSEVTLSSPVKANNITFGGIGDLTISGNLTAASYANGYINVNVDGDITWAQKNTGCGAIRFYRGNTTLAAGAKFYEGNSTGSGSRCYLHVANGAKVDFNGVSAKSNGLSGWGEITNGSDTACTLTCDWEPSGSNYYTYTPSFGGRISGNLSVSVTSGGYYGNKYTQTLSGENDSIGSLTLGGSANLSIGGCGTLGAGALYVNGATLNSSIWTAPACSGCYFKSFTYGGSSPLDLTSGPSCLNNTAVTFTINGNSLALTNLMEKTVGSALTKAGTGTLLLKGKSMYTGTTSVTAGTLELAGSSLSRTFNVASNATIRLDATGEWHPKTALAVAEGGKVRLLKNGKYNIGSFTLSGTNMPNTVTYGSVGSGAKVELDCFEGPGVLAFGTGFSVVVR